MKSERKLIMSTKWYYPAYKAGGPAKSTHLLVKALKDSIDGIKIITSGKDLDNSDVEYLSQGNNTATVVIRHYKEHLSWTKEISKDEPIYFNDFFSLKFFLLPLLILRLKGHQGKLVLAPRGMLTKGALTLKPKKKRVYILLLRILGVFKSCQLHFTDKSEYNEFKSLGINHSKPFIAANFSNEGEFIGQEAGEIVLKFVTRLSPKKNLHILLEALSELETVQLDIHGDFENEDYKQSILNKVNQNGLKQRVHFKGAFKPQDLREIYLSPSVFILPTLNENYGHSIVEALSYGIPVLISPNTPWQNLEKENAGEYLDIENVDSLKKTLILGYNKISRDYGTYRKNAFNYWRNTVNETNLENKYLEAFFG